MHLSRCSSKCLCKAFLDLNRGVGLEKGFGLASSSSLAVADCSKVCNTPTALPWPNRACKHPPQLQCSDRTGKPAPLGIIKGAFASEPITVDSSDAGLKLFTNLT